MSLLLLLLFLLQLIYDMLHDTAFPDSGLGRTILGPPENIMNITRDDLVAYITTHYTGPRIVVAGAGAVDHNQVNNAAHHTTRGGQTHRDCHTHKHTHSTHTPLTPLTPPTTFQLAELTDKSFGAIPRDPPAGYVVPDDSATFVGSDVRTRDDAMPLAHVALAVESAPWTSPHAFPLMVMQVWHQESCSNNSKLATITTHSQTTATTVQTMLGAWDRTQGTGGNMTSRLCQNVAQKDLAHSISSFNTCYKVQNAASHTNVTSSSAATRPPPCLDTHNTGHWPVWRVRRG